MDNAFHQLGQYNKAIEFQTKSLSISHELGHKAGEIAAYCSLGAAFVCLGQYDKAIEIQTKHLNMARNTMLRGRAGKMFGELGGRTEEGMALCNLGASYFGLGQYDKAIEFHTKALNIFVSWETGLGKHWRIAIWVLRSFAWVNTTRRSSSTPRTSTFPVSLGQHDKAIEFQTKHLNIFCELGDRALEGKAYCNLGAAFGCRHAGLALPIKKKLFWI